VIDRADLVLTDLRLPQMDGLQLLTAIRRQNSQTPVIVMTAFGAIETAVEAMKTGATDFLLKPFSLDHLMTVVQKALEMRALHAGSLRDHHARCADAGHRAAGGGERGGQGPDRAGHPLSFAGGAPRWQFRRGGGDA
jgi:DNA-binding NtrC family response regulator